MAKISVVSCVNDFEEYNSSVRSSFQEEQKNGTVELIPVENTSNGLSAPEALNRDLKKAIGRIIVFCHQDVIFPQNWTGDLLEQICIVEKHVRTGVFWGHSVSPEMGCSQDI